MDTKKQTATPAVAETPIDAINWWNDLAPGLNELINKQRDPKMEELVEHSLAFFSFMLETFGPRTTANQEVLKRVGSMFVHTQDVLRGLLAAQRELSPVTSSALTRIALEVRCNHTFIIKNADPLRFADRYNRFAQIEMVLRDQFAPKDTPPLLSEAELARIRVNCPEWFNDRGRVTLLHWSGDNDLRSLKALATAAGFETEYHQLYGFGSKFVHGSPLLANLYGRGGRMGALANPALCGQLSQLGTGISVRFILDAAEFYGVPIPERDAKTWHDHWMENAARLNQTK